MPSHESIASPRLRCARAARSRIGALILVALSAVPAHAWESVQVNGFALLRPQTPARIPLDDDSLSAQVQVGIDWRPSPAFGSHVHLLVRNEGDGSRRGHVGVVEAFVEANAYGERDRFRVLAGAFFLPTSRENIDSLWETPYTITSSALNSWLGEEFRPVGVDLTYTRRAQKLGAFTGGATVFMGNDTFGALPLDRGWAIHDRWTLLGEHVPSGRWFTSVSAETDHRLGWSARTKWNNNRGAIQLTRIDNRSDALLYGELYNWATRFNIAGADYTWNDWTLAAEAGWGTTAIVRTRGRFSSPIQARYVLLSRRLGKFRASVRADDTRARADRARAFTAALFWEPHARLRAGLEGITAGDERKLALELRY
ncbi:MAG: hypothetical protein WA208_18020, partial [Thermoanaerobaculia bacterium]